MRRTSCCPSQPGAITASRKQVLGVPEDLGLLFAIGFGTADPTSRLKSLDLDGLALEDSVVVHDTPQVLAST